MFGLLDGGIRHQIVVSSSYHRHHCAYSPPITWTAGYGPIFITLLLFVFTTICTIIHYTTNTLSNVTFTFHFTGRCRALLGRAMYLCSPMVGSIGGLAGG